MSQGELHVVDRLEDLPEPVPDADFVVVDVIISSTSIVRLLEAGAAYVRPFADVEAALAFGERTDDALLVGEQGGRAVEGFDEGPLPSVFGRHDIEGRPVGILTSNGTRAMDRIGRDRDVFVASTVNARAVAETLSDRERDVWVVAAGRAGDVVAEDVAGAELVACCYREAVSDDRIADLTERVRSCETAAWLDELGYGNEVEDLLAFNSSETVPRLRDGVFVDDRDQDADSVDDRDHHVGTADQGDDGRR